MFHFLIQMLVTQLCSVCENSSSLRCMYFINILFYLNKNIFSIKILDFVSTLPSKWKTWNLSIFSSNYMLMSFQRLYCKFYPPGKSKAAWLYCTDFLCAVYLCFKFIFSPDWVYEPTKLWEKLNVKSCISIFLIISSKENNYTENDFSKEENVHGMPLPELSPSRSTPSILWKNYKLTLQLQRSITTIWERQHRKECPQINLLAGKNTQRKKTENTELSSEMMGRPLSAI